MKKKPEGVHILNLAIPLSWRARLGLIATYRRVSMTEIILPHLEEALKEEEKKLGLRVGGPKNVKTEKAGD